jgi:hypothetical protein
MTAVGLEPTTNRLKVDCSTTELRGQTRCDYTSRISKPTHVYSIIPVKP